MQPGTAMQAIIERAYQVFSRYPVPQQFDVCLGCCVSFEDERALRQTPLRHVSFELLNSYAHGAYPQTQSAAETRYLLPRLLEVIAHGDYPGISQEICLQRVGKAQPENWPQTEQQLLADFARQLVIDLLADADNTHRQHQPWLGEVLVMFYLAGQDVTPLLAAALAHSNDLGFARLAYWLYMERPNGELENAFVSKSKGRLLNRQINDWIALSSQALAERAAQVIAQPPAGLDYWLEESLCALHEERLLWTL